MTSFAGFNDGDEVSGRGWVKTQTDDLIWWFVFHQGAKSGIMARRVMQVD